MRRATVVLAPGGFTGSWMWADVVGLLEKQGLEAIAAELPTIGEQSAHADFYADARAIREVLDRLEPPVLLCGHSYAGAVITEAAAGPHPAVHRLVYLTAAVPDVGDSMVSLMSTAPTDAEGSEVEGLIFREDGLAELDPKQARRALFNDCTPERAEEALRQLLPANLAGGDQPLTGAAWRQLAATYVRGNKDPMPEAVAPAFLAQGPEVLELPVGHCPNWSRPDLVAEVLASRAAPAAPELTERRSR